ncbi:MAG TPA: NrsF family protein [Thermoanaerobaculia bacterium]|nr:NrsF family protein [Thermoanaerobaculia bacterium]
MTDQRRAEFSALASKIVGDLGAIRPLLPPEARTLVVALLAASAATTVLLVLGLRTDIHTLPSGIFLSLLAARIAVGLALILFALREAIPAATPHPGARAVAIASGFGALFFFPHLFAWIAEAREAVSSAVCITGMLAVSLPSLAITFWLIGRGYAFHPVHSGVLAGLGSGVLAEAAQFLVCPGTSPFHGCAVHGGAAIGTAACGAFIGWLIATRRRRRDLL